MKHRWGDKVVVNANKSERDWARCPSAARSTASRRGGALSGFGRDGVAVFVPSHIAAQLAAFCLANSERVPAVVADAITLHLDQMEGADASLVPAKDVTEA